MLQLLLQSLARLFLSLSLSTTTSSSCRPVVHPDVSPLALNVASTIHFHPSTRVCSTCTKKKKRENNTRALREYLSLFIFGRLVHIPFCAFSFLSVLLPSFRRNHTLDLPICRSDLPTFLFLFICSSVCYQGKQLFIFFIKHETGSGRRRRWWWWTKEGRKRTGGNNGLSLLLLTPARGNNDWLSAARRCPFTLGKKLSNPLVRVTGNGIIGSGLSLELQ